MRRILLVLLVLGAAAISAAGCGEDDSTAETTAAISKAEFVKRANAICAKANEELAKTSEEFAKEQNLSEKNSPTEAQVDQLSKLALPTIARQVEELRALDAPAADQGKIDAILSAAEEAVEKGEQDPAAIYGADGGAFAKANRLATDYGLDQCGE